MGNSGLCNEINGDLNGGAPVSAPIQSVSGHYYGTTPGEYGLNWGSIYKITENGDFTLLHAFNGADGSLALGPLIQGTDFGFYGVAEGGGKYDAGVIFRISSEGYYKVLYNFDGTHGGYPIGPLIQANDGNFYGTATWRVRAVLPEAGVIFRLTPSFEFTVLHNFSGGFDGAYPAAGLVEASDGNFYGTTIRGGANGYGVLVPYHSRRCFHRAARFRQSTGDCADHTDSAHQRKAIWRQPRAGPPVVACSSALMRACRRS